jgi:rSAM/selenodomain-associated transferase 2
VTAVAPSIIVPVLDEADALTRALPQLAALRAQGAEIIIVDGGSSDGSAERCRAVADRVVQTARGRARQMNAGAAAASREVLLFLHVDTQLSDAALDLVMQALQQPSHAWGRFDVSIDGRSRWLAVVAALMNLRSRLTGIATGDQAMFVRRNAFVAVGGFPEQPLMEDIELSRRLRRTSRPVCLRDRVVTSGRRWERFGIWRTILLMWRLRLLYWLGVPAERLARSYR